MAAVTKWRIKFFFHNTILFVILINALDCRGEWCDDWNLEPTELFLTFSTLSSHIIIIF